LEALMGGAGDNESHKKKGKKALDKSKADSKP
jgi:hypothetical protein